MDKKAIIYLRVSTEEQVVNFSLITQEAACHEYAARHNFEVVDVLRDAWTGTVLNRPELNRLKSLTGQVNAVIVYTQDRFGRADRLETLMFMADLDKHGMEIHTVDKGRVDTRSFLGQMELMFKAEIAREEARKIGERSLRGKRGKALDGKIPRPGVIPYGYDWDAENHTFTINENQAAILRQIFDWYVYGDENGKRCGYTAIANKLTNLGVPSPGDVRPRKKRRNYGVWSMSGVGDIIRRDLYKGVWYYHRSISLRDKDGFTIKNAKGEAVRRKNDRENWIGVPIPVIIDEKLWELAQQQSKRNLIQSKRNTKNDYLLRGVLYCAKCGLKFFGDAYQKARGHDEKILYYRCHGQSKQYTQDGKTKTCYRCLRQAFVDSLIWDYIAQVLLNPDLILETLNLQKEELAQHYLPIMNDLQSSEQKIAELGKKRDRIISLHVDGILSKEELSKRLVEVENHIKLETEKQAYLQQQLAQYDLSDFDADSIKSFCMLAAQGIEHFTFEDKRMVIEALKIRVIVQRGANMNEDTFTITGIIPHVDISAVHGFTFAQSKSRCARGCVRQLNGCVVN